MKFTTHIEIPVEIEYEYEKPEPDVGYAGGINVQWTIPDLNDIDFEEICQEHWDGWCEEQEAAKLDYYDALRETQLYGEITKDSPFYINGKNTDNP